MQRRLEGNSRSALQESWARSEILSDDVEKLAREKVHGKVSKV
jgi:hypothetical protein